MLGTGRSASRGKENYGTSDRSHSPSVGFRVERAPSTRYKSKPDKAQPTTTLAEGFWKL
jgi:hypothetical protein